jgi:ubiquinol-cytochrome c reductase cytochrome b subunit
MWSKIYRWIDARWPLGSLLRLGREEEIPGGTSFAYTLGSVTLFVFLLQMATGVAQLFYYVPTVDHAYDSLNYFRADVPFGWLIHGLHYWGANAMVVLLGLHMIRVFIWGAYKAPRQLIWLTGVGLLILTAGLSFTGAPLPWDERGYWALEVGTSIAGTIPMIGHLIEPLLRGGEAMGQLTLSRFFVLHAVLLPGMLLALIGVHLVAFRRFGSVGPWEEARRSRSGPFWPDQATKDIVVIALLSLVLIGLSAYKPPPITGPADPLDTSYLPKPEWNFLFLYEALKFLPGWLEPVGTVGLPTVVVLVLTSLPFLDRGPERNPARRPLIMTSGLILVGTVVALTAAGLLGRIGQTKTGAGAVAVGPLAGRRSAIARQGARLFTSLGCIGCHRANGKGGTLGPDLSHEALRNRSHRWLFTQIRDPRANDPHSIMPPFSSLNNQQLQALIAYLLSLTNRSGGAPVTTVGTASPAASATPGPPGAAASMIGSAHHGAVLFGRHCASCHGKQGKGLSSGAAAHAAPALAPIDPALFSQEPDAFADDIDRIIQHGLTPAGPQEVGMPAFGDHKTLTQQEIADIEAYVMQLNGVNRAQLVHAGLAPRRFFHAVLALVALVALGLGVLWKYLRVPRQGTP